MLSTILSCETGRECRFFIPMFSFLIWPNEIMQIIWRKYRKHVEFLNENEIRPTRYNMNIKLAIPDAAPLVLSLRSVGYTLETALADIIDNSITAKATEINIDVKWSKDLNYISVRDNGFGMNEADLHQAMRIGSKNPIDPRGFNDLGRFGMGLKTAAFSLCKRLTVGSKLLGTKAMYVRVWDIDNIAETNRWELFDGSSTPNWEDALRRFDNREQGTIVVLEKLDRLITENLSDQAIGRFWQRIADMEKHLSMVFHRFLSGDQAKAIFINGKRVEPFLHRC